MPTPRSPEDILGTELKEIYSAERQLTRTIPKLAKRVQNPRLKQMLETRREQGENLINDLDQALEEMQVTKSRPKNVAAEGLIEDINQHVEELDDETLVEPMLIAGIQKVEHYCIAAWGTARSMGRLMNQDRVVKAMDRVLDEGRKLDDQLTELAEKEVNPAMLQGQGGDGSSGRRGRGGGSQQAGAH
jgi:ferritin-like metal-binding protein YciE